MTEKISRNHIQNSRNEKLYKFLKARKNEHKIYLTIDQFREIVDAEGKYLKTFDLRNRVIIVALNQIRKKYNMEVSCKSVFEKNYVIGFLFIVEDLKNLESVANRAFGEAGRWASTKFHKTNATNTRAQTATMATFRKMTRAGMNAIIANGSRRARFPGSLCRKMLSSFWRCADRLYPFL